MIVAAWPPCIFVLSTEHAAIDFTLAQFEIHSGDRAAEVIEFAFLNRLATNSAGDLTKRCKHLHFLSRLEALSSTTGLPEETSVALYFWTEDSFMAAQ